MCALGTGHTDAGFVRVRYFLTGGRLGFRGSGRRANEGYGLRGSAPMQARVVVASGVPGFATKVSDALRAEGYEAIAFPDSMSETAWT